MSLPSLATLIVQETASAVFAKLLGFMQSMGVNTEAWAVGDPTRSSLSAVASWASGQFEPGISQAIAGGFLGLARGDWLTLKTHYDYSTDRIGAESATCTVLLTNAKGGVYDFAPGDLTVQNSTTSATFRNTSGGHLGAGPATTLALDVVADVAGSGGTSNIGAIDTMVTTFTGVTCSNTTAAIGIDEEEDDPLVARASLKFESLSPDGPRGAYVFVATTPAQNGGANVNRARSYGNTTNGVATIYIASPSGAAAGGDATLVQAAVIALCTPLCTTPTVVSATAVPIAVTYALNVYSSINLSDANVAALADAAITALFAAANIGGDVVPPGIVGTSNGIMAKSLIEAAILGAMVTTDANGKVIARHGISCTVSLPSGDTAITPSQVPTKGTVTPTVVQVVPS